MNIERYGRHWGDNIVFGDEGDTLLDSLEQKDWDTTARTLGFSEACPVVDRLIESRGAEPMARRYAEVMYWRGHFQRTLIEHNQNEWANQLTKSTKRLTTEPMGTMYDEQWIPTEHYSHLSGAGSPLSYALPRAMTTFINVDGRDKGDRVIEALNIFEEVIPQANNLTELVVGFIDGLATIDGDAIPYLKNLIGLGKLDEDNCYSAYLDIIATILTSTPFLASKYNEIFQAGELEKHRICNINDL